MRYRRKSTSSFFLSVAWTSISVRTPKPSAFRASGTFARASSKPMSRTFRIPKSATSALLSLGLGIRTVPRPRRPARLGHGSGGDAEPGQDPRLQRDPADQDEEG